MPISSLTPQIRMDYLFNRKTKEERSKWLIELPGMLNPLGHRFQHFVAENIDEINEGGLAALDLIPEGSVPQQAIEW